MISHLKQGERGRVKSCQRPIEYLQKMMDRPKREQLSKSGENAQDRDLSSKRGDHIKSRQPGQCRIRSTRVMTNSIPAYDNLLEGNGTRARHGEQKMRRLHGSQAVRKFLYCDGNNVTGAVVVTCNRRCFKIVAQL
jgi:hypothetical protein